MTLDPYVWTCSTCTRDIDERKEKPWTEVIGWERRRDQGGTNHVAMRKPTGNAICNECMIRLQAGLAPGQLSLT